jgi:hypothetical protein
MHSKKGEASGVTFFVWYGPPTQFLFSHPGIWVADELHRGQ